MSKCARRVAQRRGGVGGVQQQRRGGARAAARPRRGSARAARRRSVAGRRRRWRSASSRPRARARGAAATAAATRVGLVGVARAEPAHAGVELDVHARRAPRRGQRGDEALAPGDDVGAGARARRRAPRRVSAPITSSGAVDRRPRAARAASRGGRDGQPRRAAGQRRARGGRGAVPVAVGLDDRAQRAPRAALARAAARRCARSPRR